MPISSTADKMTINYFCSNYPAFKKKADELIEQSASHEWVWERSLFSDASDFNRLHLKNFDLSAGRSKRSLSMKQGTKRSILAGIACSFQNKTLTLAPRQGGRPPTGGCLLGYRERIVLNFVE